MSKTKVLLADDHPMVIVGLRKVLENGGRYRVVGHASSPSELVKHMRDLSPDIVITDYNMPGDSIYADGLTLVGYLRRNFPQVRLLIYTMITSPVLVTSLYEAGVHGVLSKNHEQAEILVALETIAANRIYHKTGPAFASNRNSLDATARIGTLSPREMEILRHFLVGVSVGDIARIMNRSVKTISTHKVSAMHKLGVRTDHELVMFGVNYNLFE
ncbi:response regulator transcription factor [Achromobacter xylosoxidans]|nr:response regulator transcription factor [Achromobacter xylosoxidans]